MIQLTRLNHQTFYINSDLIETIETTPDTVISMTTGRRLLVIESADEILQKIIQFRVLCSINGRFACQEGQEKEGSET
ncbi:MAG: flagellar FlbD family protein [Clostridiaceae bacterium]|nr:flagellar FlbD family protein [Clostridiaceae bacterium]